MRTSALLGFTRRLAIRPTFSPSLFMRTFTMNTRILPVNPANLQFESSAAEFGKQNAKSVITSQADQAAIEEAVALLKAGEAVGIPTETVYGLAANALSSEAVAKIFAAKNRPQDNPLIVHISSLTMLESLLPNNTIPPVYHDVIRNFWPGPLTIIVPTSSLIPGSVTCHQSTVGIRFPSHPVARALIDACGFPLAAPSANASGKPSTTLASHVYDDLKGRIPLILDGGPCDVGVESTVLDGLRSPPAILRPGGVSYEALRTLPTMQGLRVYRKHFVDKALEEAPTTPGMKYRHYSPEAAVILIDTRGERNDKFYTAFESTAKEQVEAMRASGKQVSKIGVLKTTHEHDNQKHTSSLANVECISIAMGRSGHPEEVARSIFRGLRELDADNVDLIFVEGIPETEEGMAVMNRLQKAASKIIEI